MESTEPARIVGSKRAVLLLATKRLRARSKERSLLHGCAIVQLGVPTRVSAFELKGARPAKDPIGTYGRKRRGSDSHMCHVLDGTVVIAAPPERRPAGISGREGYQQPRPRKLT